MDTVQDVNNLEAKPRTKQLIRTELFSGEFGNFFISTCYRPSSAVGGEDMWYYETFAWKLNDKGERTDWVADNSGAITEKIAIDQHVEVCKQLREKGEYKQL